MTMSTSAVIPGQSAALAATIRAVVAEIDAGEVEASETARAYLRGAVDALECATGAVSIS